MIDIFTKLQRKPEPARRRFAFFAAVALTGVIVLLWLVSLAVRGGDETTVARDARESTAGEQSPFAALREAVGAFVSGTETLVRDARGVFGETRNETDEERRGLQQSDY